MGGKENAMMKPTLTINFPSFFSLACIVLRYEIPEGGGEGGKCMSDWQAFGGGGGEGVKKGRTEEPIV